MISSLGMRPSFYGTAEHDSGVMELLVCLGGDESNALRDAIKMAD